MIIQKLVESMKKKNSCFDFHAILKLSCSNRQKKFFLPIADIFKRFLELS
jgi:hypothetical protein